MIRLRNTEQICLKWISKFKIITIVDFLYRSEIEHEVKQENETVKEHLDTTKAKLEKAMDEVSDNLLYPVVNKFPK